MGKSKVIALDCDGVLLDYVSAYGKAWELAFGENLTVQNPSAYWPLDRWGLPRLEGEPLQKLKAVFDEAFWSSIAPLPGAVEACHRLVAAGYELVCVTALEAQYREARERNLQNLGFPISEVIATGGKVKEVSPKAQVINRLRPTAFVDDYGAYLLGIDAAVHKALILREPEGSPNVGEVLQLADSTHADLAAFATWWCDTSR